MSLKPLFATAPRIKLRINNQVVAYAIGFNINVSVTVQPIFVVGRYAPVSLEPTMYNTVTGTLQIARLLRTSHINSGAKDSLSGSAQDSGSAIDGATFEETDATAPAGKTNTILGQNELYKHFTPSQLLTSQSFDMILYMKVPKADGTGIEEVEWMKATDCRLTSRNKNISMGQLVNEPMNFQGLLATHAASPFQLDSKVNAKN